MTTASASIAPTGIIHTPNGDYETIIGVEVHVQLNTTTKLFCGDTLSFGDAPNDHTCPICLGYPGVLPVLNQQAVEKAVTLGLALGCTIATVCKFDRKHYFYPDLPKAYQISQFDEPLCSNGTLTLANGRVVGIQRAHLEEDAGKLNHVGAEGLAGSLYSLVDLNRAGTPLLEVVSHPDLRSGEECKEYMATLRNLVRCLNVCDGNLEEGSMRCDANVSVRKVGATQYGTRAEVKNMNSLRSIQRAVEYEAQRQVDLVESGGRVVQETRLWNDATGTTISMRGKEAANDYRYFPEPDLPPLRLSVTWLETMKANLPELPKQRHERYTQTIGLPDFEANLLTENHELGQCFDSALALTADNKALHKPIANWLVGDITAWLNTEKRELSATKLTPALLVELVTLLDAQTIGSAVAKQLLPELLTDGASPKALVESRGLGQINDTSALEALVAEVLAANPAEVEAYKGGKTKLMGFFVGQVMKATQGKANAATMTELLQRKLGS
jgi:aspartyl-tRNA(Asn)/glutamyl-tRNA(Gln) amidotransferase subunit B